MPHDHNSNCTIIKFFNQIRYFYYEIKEMFSVCLFQEIGKEIFRTSLGEILLTALQDPSSLSAILIDG